MKYIDAEKLKAEIRKYLIPTVCDRHYDEWERGRDSGFIQVISIIESLQQEQPEVDLEKEFNNFLDSVEGVPRMWHSDEQIEWAKSIAKHFFELGLIARKED